MGEPEPSDPDGDAPGPTLAEADVESAAGGDPVDAAAASPEAAETLTDPGDESPAESSTLDVAQVAGERDEYLDALRHLQADFENFKKRTVKQQGEAADRATESLVEKLLPVLDTVDLARSHGAGEAVDQVATALVDVLGREGLERLGEGGQPFDPTEHDAVLHEDGDGEPVIVDVMRAGYRWRGRLLRPAMVKVKGS